MTGEGEREARRLRVRRAVFRQYLRFEPDTYLQLLWARLQVTAFRPLQGDFK
jgi:hypothetical protein